MACSSLNRCSKRYRVPTVSLSAYRRYKNGLVEFIYITATVWMLAGCHTTADTRSGINSDLSETTLSSSVMTRPPISSQSPVEKYGPKKNNDEVPLWERPEILAKYPVKAKKNPDGSYDYSDPRFENADLCEDAPPGYWESRGFIKKTSSKDEFLHFNACLLRETNETQSLLVDFGTDKRSREEVPGKRVENENPTTFTRWGRIVGDPHCVVYTETQLGRVAVQAIDETQTLNEAELCDLVKKLNERLT